MPSASFHHFFESKGAASPRGCEGADVVRFAASELAGLSVVKLVTQSDKADNPGRHSVLTNLTISVRLIGDEKQLPVSPELLCPG